MRWIIPSCLILLSAISLITLRSVAPSLLPIQATFVGLGTIAFLVSWQIGFDWWLSQRWLLYTGLIFLLILTLLLAEATRGAVSWIEIGGIRVQGSQLAGPIVGLVLAQFVAQKGLNTPKAIAMFLGLLMIPASLIVIAPDLGTTVILLISMMGIALVSNMDTKWIAGGAAVGVLVMSIAWLFFLAPYQKARITSFIQPTGDIQGSGYNARQALIAVGSGQLLGRGIGQGIQSHLRFLPERHTDFIFASIAEEWGFVGSILVILLYFVLIGTYLFKAWQIEESAAYYFLVATAFFFLFQVMVNIGMNMQLMPITGITLPFISYGGSSFLAFCFHCGVAQSILTKPIEHESQHFG